MTAKMGIVGQIHGDKFGVNIAYMNLIEELNFSAVILPPTSSYEFRKIYQFDALLLPGGADVNPLNYGEVPSFRTDYQNPILEYFDRNVLPVLIDTKMPIIGICRGLQALNVFFGGTLHQDLPWHPHSAQRDDIAHQIKFSDSNGGLVQRGVNSLHHQGINILGKDLISMAVSSKDNLVEAFRHKSRNIFAVQWHPEEIFDEFAMTNFRSILR